MTINLVEMIYWTMSASPRRSNFALSCIAFVRNLAFDVFVSLARTHFTTAIYKLVLQTMQSNSFETGGDSAGPSSLTVSDRRRAAHRDLVKRGTGRRKRARREHSRARQDGEAAGSSVLQPEGDEHEINSDTNNNFDGHEHYDSEPDQPVQDLSGRSQPDTGPADDEHAHSQEDRRSISPLRSPPPPDPDPARNEDAAQPPQRNLDQRARIDVDVDALEHVAVLPKQKDAIMFIRALQSASLDDPCAKLNNAALQRLRHPLQEPLHIEEPAIRHGIISYFALEHSANEAYERIRNSAARNFEGAAEIPSHARIERLIAEYTGIESIEHDMCPDTCVAFTGPFAELVNCPICGTERYDPIKLHDILDYECKSAPKEEEEMFMIDDT
ncbi:hypothetical protein BDR05DRAFT_952037 [Suillus weaverae]|nr:hypothetical protein BDR05DRAFT_952037 [Suillus weaverae]